MDIRNSEHIPSTRAAIQATDSLVNNEDDDHEQPTSSIQSTTNPTTIVQSTNTFTLEIPVLLLFFSWNLSGTVFQNQVLYQSCILTYNASTCDLLTNDKITPEMEVEINDFPIKSTQKKIHLLEIFQLKYV